MLPDLPGKMLEHHSSKVMTYALRNTLPSLQLQTNVLMIESFPTPTLHLWVRNVPREAESIPLLGGQLDSRSPQKKLQSSSDRQLPVILLGRILIAGR